MADQEINPLDMPDDEINEALIKEFARSSNAESEKEEPTAEVKEETAEEDPIEEEQPDDQDEEIEGNSENAAEDDVSNEGSPEPFSESNQAVTEESDDDEAPKKEEESKKVDETATIDYKDAYETLFAPFKANGKDMKIDSVDDARTLMQMGANYNKKMAAIKPNLKLMKMLENNDLLDSERLSYLIDLDKKNPEAIKKLLADSKIDPLDLDLEDKGASYRPNTYNVSDSEIALDSVLAEIKDSPSFSKTMNVVGTEWDTASQDIIVKDPEIIRALNNQVESGLFDQIMSVVERERVLGRLNGVSDIQAYYQIGQSITANEGGNPTQSQGKLQTNNVNRANNTVDPKLASRKKAASSTKSAPRTAVKEDYNPLSMSDEEFEKMVSSKFI